MLNRPTLIKLAKGVAEFCLFQGAWFACVLGAAHGEVGWGVLAVVVWVLISWSLSDQRRVDVMLALQAVTMGLVWDTWMLRGGWVDYAAPGPAALWAPVWILALWALFATLVRGPLSWLHGRPWLAALLGAIGGPMSYLAAVRLGAGRFPDPTQSLLVLGMGWAVMTPMLTEMARWLLTRTAGNKAASRG
ncbi:DUF2878 domain-containing protein [Roseateles sp. SL47]|uniref:DUF2878 domain-containing protein n=1 Tax=Roseateles sp. SL47 TaxID=2995138 RepID=UPI0022719AD1|nr:DUF2878 domain-containing protein [Roseateles sp. SL47]WAC72708.1 DUF2878 domain-containing protein [Roseateles sp. SL47]